MDKKNPNKTFKRPVDDKEDVVLSKGYFHFEVSQEEVAQAVKVMKERDFNNDIHWFDEKDEEVEPEPTCGNPCTNPCAEAPLYGRETEETESTEPTDEELVKKLAKRLTKKYQKTVNPCANFPPYNRDEDKLYEDKLERYNEDEEDR